MKLLSLGVAFGVWLSVSASEEVPVITTEEGKVSGIVEESVNGKAFYSYLGIPYAKPPIGELRFKDPVMASSWEGVRNGSMPSPCLQISYLQLATKAIPAPEGLKGDEDCLYLNVFTPKVAHSQGNLPVMVYIHGGSFFAGAAKEYLPNVMLDRDIILVVMQYRLGFLGFLSAEDSVIPGNYGLKDQTLSLQWVQRNIRNFGGDPQKVTIFGESGGSTSVHFQILTPKAKGLFIGAIMQSGTAMIPRALDGKHRRYAKYVGSVLGCDIENGSQAFLQCMQSTCARKLTALIPSLNKWSVFPTVTPPRVDGDYLPDHPARLLKEGRYNKVNLISGITANEGAVFTIPMYADDNLIHELESKYSVNGPHSLQWYIKDEDPLKLSHQVYNYYLGGVNIGPEYAEDFTKMIGDQHYAVSHDQISELHARETSVSTFRYELTHRGQYSYGDLFDTNIGRHWVSHVDDLFYLFPVEPIPNKETEMRLTTPDDLILSNIILTLWTNFAIHGHPTPDNTLGFEWEPTSADNLRHLDISPTPSMANDSRKEVRKFLYSLPTEINRILNPEMITKG